MICAVLSVLLSACGQSACPPFAPDSTKIMPWSAFTNDGEPFRYPYLVTYEACGRQLLYVAAEHTGDPDSLTHRLIDRAFEEYDIPFAILEGFALTDQPSPQDLVDYADEVAGTPQDGENAVVIRKITAAGGHFVGAEPTQKTVLAHIKEQGLTVQDLLGFHIVRILPQWIRHQQIKDHTDGRVRPLYQAYAERFVASLDLTLDDLGDLRSFDGFKSWYQQTNGVAYDTHFRPQDSAPSSTQNRRTNQISDMVGHVREAHIVGVIADAMNTYRRVLVVYGASHHTVQEPALTAMFGEPSYVREAFLGPSGS